MPAERCSKCERWQPLDQFALRPERGTRRTVCKSCRNADAREKRRRDYEPQPCCECGAPIPFERGGNGAVTCSAVCRHKRQLRSLMRLKQMTANDPEFRERRNERVRKKRDTDSEWAASCRQRQRDRYDNDVLYRHGRLLKQQLKRSNKRLQKAQEAHNG